MDSAPDKSDLGTTSQHARVFCSVYDNNLRGIRGFFDVIHKKGNDPRLVQSWLDGFFHSMLFNEPDNKRLNP